jgi:VWFA-related protein
MRRSRPKIWAAAVLCAAGAATTVWLTRAPSPLLVRLSAAPEAARPQTPPAPSPPDQQPRFRAGATFVRVDVYPRLDGQVIPDLGRGDFQVFEDGRPQTVETFEFIRFEPNTPDAERRDPNNSADSERQAADPRNRVFVVYIDPYHTSISGSFYAASPTVEFLTRTIGATDLFAVMVPETPIRQLVFARRTDTLESELRKYWPWGIADSTMRASARNDFEFKLLSCSTALNPTLGELLVDIHRDETLFNSLSSLIERLGGLKDERKNVLFISEGFVPRQPTPGLIQRTYEPGDEQVPPITVTPGGRLGVGRQDVPGAPRDRSFCNTQIMRLAHLDFDKRFAELIDQAIRANVSFYPLNPAGLTVGNNMARQSALLTLAENTDGRAVVNTNDLNGAVRRLTDSLSGHYVLGYYSTNTEANGRFREITVKVNRPEVTIAARRGYYAATPEMVAAMNAPSAAVGPSPVDAALERLARLRSDAELHTYSTAGTSALSIVAEIASGEIARGRWRQGGEVEVVVAPATGTEVRATGRIAPGARAALVTVPTTAEANPYRVTVRVTGVDGALESRLDVDTYDGHLLGAPLGYRALPSPRAPIRPVADFQYRRTERVHIEWPALVPLESRSVRVLDRLGQPLTVGATVDEKVIAGRPGVSVDLILAPMAEGDYVIELVAGAGGATERDLVAFRVVR